MNEEATVAASACARGSALVAARLVRSREDDIYDRSMEMSDRLAPVEPATDALARHRARLVELMAQRGVTRRDELLDSFRGSSGQLVEDEAFHEADHVLGLVESLEELTEG